MQTLLHRPQPVGGSLPRRHAVVFAALTCVLALGLPAGARLPWDHAVSLARRYRPGQKMVYDTRVQAKAAIDTDPPGLKAFLPPVPTQISSRQQNTVTVRQVDAAGTAEIENHFDTLDFDSNLVERSPDPLKDSMRQDQRRFVEQIEGLKLVARYDRQGRLIDFAGADAALDQLSAPLRAPVREGLRLLLEQMSGNTLDPGRPVRPGQHWSRQFSVPPTESFPWGLEGQTTWDFVSETHYGKTRAAAIDYVFDDHLSPPTAGAKLPGALGEIGASPGHRLDAKLTGAGEGRLLVAIDDGRILQNEVHTHQALAATLYSVRRGSDPEPRPISVNIQGEAGLEMRSQ